ncbi:hypothetical protein ABB55_27605 [Prosthecomicrobium hirschii]|uniref:Uncharacterized protein n=1 Tax=Prosthecodimorpha hirschii TaxID=665126 RepID=A0A0P6W8P2_9HYPH|nr:hypothetical protein ABB55_27605 [Prosthecomicrobium hirschii]
MRRPVGAASAAIWAAGSSRVFSAKVAPRVWILSSAITCMAMSTWLTAFRSFRNRFSKTEPMSITPTMRPSFLAGTVPKMLILSRPGSMPTTPLPVCSASRTVTRRASTLSPKLSGAWERAKLVPSGFWKLNRPRFSRSRLIAKAGLTTSSSALRSFAAKASARRGSSDSVSATPSARSPRSIMAAITD